MKRRAAVAVDEASVVNAKVKQNTSLSFSARDMANLHESGNQKLQQQTK